MPVTDSLIREQIHRFRNFKRFPDQYGITALKRAFIEACDTDEAVVSVADELERTLKAAPLPSDIWEASERLAARLAWERQEAHENSKRKVTPIQDQGWWNQTLSESPGRLADTHSLLRSKRADIRSMARQIAERYNRWLEKQGRHPEFSNEEVSGTVSHA